jgi:hypothetical protein
VSSRLLSRGRRVKSSDGTGALILIRCWHPDPCSSHALDSLQYRRMHIAPLRSCIVYWVLPTASKRHKVETVA